MIDEGMIEGRSLLTQGSLDRVDRMIASHRLPECLGINPAIVRPALTAAIGFDTIVA